VVVPEQTIQNGVVELEIVEGYVGRVVIDGDAGDLKPWIEAYLRRVVQTPDDGERAPPVRRGELERALLLVDDLPGVTVRAVLRPPEATEARAGESELVLRVERTRFEAAALADNRGSRFTGPERAMLLGWENSALDRRERVELQALSTLGDDEQRYGALIYDQPFGTRGWAARFLANYADSAPGSTLAPLDLQTRSARLSASVSYPIILQQRRSLYLLAGLDASRLDVDALGADFSHDDLRVVHAGVRYEFGGCGGGLNAVGFELRQGLQGLGATSDSDPLRSRATGRSDFTSLLLEASHSQRFARILALNVGVKAQYAFDTLLSDEEFLLGGEQYGRGYDSAELTGESGVGVTVELRYQRSTSHRALQFYQPYAFYDAGVVWNDDPGVNERLSLASAGLGLRAQLYRRFDLAFEIAQPLTRDVAAEGDRDPRFFLQLSARR
jgi:hemolysin activation/secretion protein